ncbi:hypothetical protein TWF696_005950 [Orbilia brochopaga]|uniref:TRP C-terminal domain-containing protein n=1 Tax=Orbilia brochopaga TaxID=3140254 RepID=A0AAV9UY30_9PEZI
MAAAVVAAVCLAPLRALLAVVLFVVSPVTATAVYFGRLVVSLFGIPLWLARKLSVLYVYLGTASLVGICIAVLFYLFYAATVALLGLNQRPRRPITRYKPQSSTINSHIPSRVRAADARVTPSFSIPSDSSRWLGGSVALTAASTSGRAGMGMGAIDVLGGAAASISPTSSLSPGLATRQRIFPILEEEDEHEEDVVRRRRKGRTLKR